MIEIQNITFGYRRKFKIFNDLSLNLEAGKIYGLFGVNGAGKTTLLKQIGGLLRASSGKIEIGDKNIASRNADVLSQIFLVPEEFALPSIKASQFTALNKPFYRNFDNSLYQSIMNEFEIYDHENLSAMSYGQKKKFLISFAIATQTPIILFDEPTNGLDIPSKSQFRRIMAQVITDDKCFVISTHQVRDLSSMIDHVMMIDKGKIVFNQSTYEISKKLLFKHTTDNVPDNVLYSEDTGTLKKIVSEAKGEESEIDFETLFNAVIKNEQIINNAFKIN